MVAFLAFIPELIGAVAEFIGATWWTLPVQVGLWKVQEAVTSPPPPAGTPQSPAQQAAAAAGQAAQGAGSAVGGAGQALGSFGQFLSQNPWVVPRPRSNRSAPRGSN